MRKWLALGIASRWALSFLTQSPLIQFNRKKVDTFCKRNCLQHGPRLGTANGDLFVLHEDKLTGTDVVSEKELNCLIIVCQLSLP